MKNKSIDDILDNLINQINQTSPKQNSDGFQDISYGRVLDKQMTKPNSPTMCYLKPGGIYYKPLNAQGWPVRFPICREGGSIPNNGQEFEYRGERKACVVGQEAIDFSKINESSPNVLDLVEVKANFVGTIFVEKGSIAEIINGSNNEKGILLG